MGVGMRGLSVWVLVAAAAAGSHAESRAVPALPAATYADLADLALAAPVVAHLRVTRSTRLKNRQAAGVAAGKSRFYVEAEVLSLIKGAEGLPAKVSYLLDLPNDPAGKPPKLARKSEHLVFAATVAGRPGEIRLVTPQAHLPFAPTAADQVRGILSEAARADAAPRISGIGRAFHVAGALPGESETQIFLQAADGRPLSLNVLRRPGEQPRWAVALSEIVDDAAGPPQRETLLWYRLACTLPRALPPLSLADSGPAQAQAIEADYRLIVERLGPCARSLGAL